MSLLLLLGGARVATPAPTPPAPTPPAPVQETGSPMWGPWKPIKPRPLIRGRVVVRLDMPNVTVAGTVAENEDWLLGIPTEESLATQ